MSVEATEAYAVGPLDLILLFSFIGLIVYWFMRKKSEPKSRVNGLIDLQPVNIQNLNNVDVVDSSGFVSKMKKSGKTIAIFYGSQTGTAEEFSQRLAKDSQRYGLKSGVFDPEECEMDELIELKTEIDKSLAIFVVATYGEGDPTDNAIPFYDWLKEEQDFEGLNYVVFALGNKTYEHYQGFGRYVDKRVAELGGNRIFEIGEGDDDGNIEEDFVNWREKFWVAACGFYGVSNDSRRLSQCVSRDFTLRKFPDITDEKIFKGEITKLGAFANQRPPYDAKNPYMADLVVNREIHKGGERSCMHIEIDISNSGIRYEAGDHVAVYPTNDPELVDTIGKLLCTDLDEVISLNNVDEDAAKKHPFPCPCSYRTALLHYIDITSTVKHHVLTELIQYTKEEKDLEMLRKLLSSDEEGKNLYNEWVVKNHRHITSVLEDLPSCKPPLDLLLELLPRLHCRYYSISSSPKMHKSKIHITAVLVDWIAPTGRRQKGVATSWLKEKIPSNETLPKVPIFVRHTTFRLPEKLHLPVLMIGPGTGFAPFRGFIQDRHSEKETGKDIGEINLYFGCRHKAEDFIYEEEINEFVTAGTITDLQLAFSRDQEEKFYVTHKLKENEKKIWELIKAGGHLYVCGDARHMAKDVHAIFISAIKTYGEKSEQQANNFLSSLSNKGRYSVDVWS